MGREEGLPIGPRRGTLLDLRRATVPAIRGRVAGNPSVDSEVGPAGAAGRSADTMLIGAGTNLSELGVSKVPLREASR
jgi:hypothetical protein